MLKNRKTYTYLFIAVAVCIAVSSLLISNKLTRDLSLEERKKMEVWATATQAIATASDEADLSLILKIVQSNTTIPVILFDQKTGAILANNMDIPRKDSLDFLKRTQQAFAKKHAPIVMPEINQLLYYDDSTLLKRLQVYPYIQLSVLLVFIALAFFTLRTSQRSEQNKLWVGLSKETAHQLGTPLSSLNAWMELLKLKNDHPAHILEIEKDVARLNRIADRFSKIGSVPKLEEADIPSLVRDTAAYLRKRISDNVEIRCLFPEKSVVAHVNEALFSWVIENITKNAVDAMSGKGVITYTLSERENQIVLDISDTGKGIASSKFKTVFNPGFTTKERGWGLGLSLVKRIVEQYHQGKIFVKSSEIGKGTTFRIVLKK